MLLAVSRAAQPRVVIPSLIDRFAIQVGKPRLDTPCRDENGHSVAILPGLDLLRPTSLNEGIQARLHATIISVQHDKKGLPDLAAPRPVRREFDGKVLAHELLGGPATLWSLLDAQSARRPAQFVEEAADEGIVLRVLAEQDKLNVSAHRSHPLATISESLSPPSVGTSAKLPAFVTPELSRLRSIPRSPPR